MVEPSLGERMREARFARGMTISQVASCVGVDNSTVRRWEHDRSVPIVALRRLIARTLQVHMSDLFGET